MKKLTLILAIILFAFLGWLAYNSNEVTVEIVDSDNKPVNLPLMVRFEKEGSGEIHEFSPGITFKMGQIGRGWYKVIVRRAEDSDVFDGNREQKLYEDWVEVYKQKQKITVKLKHLP